VGWGAGGVRVGCGWGEIYLRESRPMNKPVRAAKPTALSGC
jgi:hypothetical protein